MKMKKKFARVLVVLAILLALLLVAFFLFRNSLLQNAIGRVSAKVEKRYNSTLTVGSAEFDGLTGIKMRNVSLAPKGQDTLFSIKHITTSVGFWPLLTGDIQVGRLDVSDGYVQLERRDSIWNFAAFLKRDDADDTSDNSSETHYAKRAYRLISKALDLVPTEMKVEKLALIIRDNGKNARVDVRQLTLSGEQLESAIDVQTDTFRQRWRIAGMADPRDNRADIRLFNRDTGAIRMPYLDERYNLKASFDSVRLKVDDIDMSGGELSIDGYTSVANLHVNHPKIASKDVVIRKADFDYRFLLGKDFVSIDSSSTVRLNWVKLHPYVSYSTEKDTVYALKVNIPKMKAQDFIESLPTGLFTHFEGMEARGNFAFALDFRFNKNNPKDLVFDSNLEKENLEIVKYGAADLNKLNGDFVYHAIENGRQQRGVLVGQANPNYTPLSEISPYLRKCVLTTEDPSFFHHKGFIAEAFRQSIIQNIRTKRFARGASTISMQLVKNVFLTREKTLSRKLEEILLVYIMENNRIVSKDRMLEVYFNIIEWGPNIYGVGEASRFYFDKHPSMLSLNECLFMANIIPRPKGFMYQFAGDGSLRRSAVQKQDYLTNIMMRRGLLTADDTIYKSLPVEISGRARNLIRISQPDSVVVEPVEVPDEFDF